MTPKEFKAWFDGFTEAMDGQPTAAQWAKIKERVAQIDGNPTSYPVYVDRYWPTVRPWYRDCPSWGDRVLERFTVTCNASMGDPDVRLLNAPAGAGKSFDATSAMSLLGRADYACEVAA